MTMATTASSLRDVGVIHTRTGEQLDGVSAWISSARCCDRVDLRGPIAAGRRLAWQDQAHGDGGAAAAIVEA
ncbi:hypothetical protein, partial [Clostridium perfringens]